jgi:hypothetical protein
MRVCVCWKGSEKEEMEMSKVSGEKVEGVVSEKVEGEKMVEGLSVKKWEGGKKKESDEIVMKKEWVEKVNSLGSVSDKIRYLNSVGLNKGEISKVLGIRFNWVYNVLRNESGGSVGVKEVKIRIVE